MTNDEMPDNSQLFYNAAGALQVCHDSEQLEFATEYLLATPARKRAEELVSLLDSYRTLPAHTPFQYAVKELLTKIEAEEAG